MEARNWTGVFILWLLLQIVIYDLYACYYLDQGSTITALVRECEKCWPLLSPIFAFACGVLYWHFFW